MHFLLGLILPHIGFLQVSELYAAMVLGGTENGFLSRYFYLSIPSRENGAQN
ncbi:MAG: hypothetical protein GY856_19075 [bacterium]|nr:hypothetical protein [bacterium]